MEGWKGANVQMCKLEGWKDVLGVRCQVLRFTFHVSRIIGFDRSGTDDVSEKHERRRFQVEHKKRVELGKYVVSDPAICHGKLTFKGTRCDGTVTYT